eukprot:COSAG05_NODE_2293_length_3266_cov_456.310073_2_plen_86_part_00
MLGSFMNLLFGFTYVPIFDNMQVRVTLKSVPVRNAGGRAVLSRGFSDARGGGAAVAPVPVRAIATASTRSSVLSRGIDVRACIAL